MKNEYTISDISRTLSVNERTARRYVEKHLFIKGKSKILSEEFFNFLIQNHNLSDTERTGIGQALDTDFRTEKFTEEEYQEFQKRLIEYPIFKKHIESLKEEIDYHKKQYDKLMDLHNDFIQVHKMSLKNIEQRNYIEAKEKRIE